MKQTVYQQKGIIGSKERQKSYTRHINNLHKVYEKDYDIFETMNSVQEKIDFQHKNRMNTQKYKQDQEKMKIQKENKKLLAALINISENDKAYQQAQEAASLILVQPSSKKYQKQQERLKISDENFQLAYRMVNLPSVYQKKQQDAEYKIHKDRVSKLKKFQPEHFFDPYSSQYSTKSSHRSYSPMSKSYMIMNFKSKKINGKTNTSFYAPQSTTANQSFSVNIEHSNSPPKKLNESLNNEYKGNIKGYSPIFNQNDRYYGEPLKDTQGVNSNQIESLNSQRNQQYNDQIGRKSIQSNQKNLNNLDNIQINSQFNSINHQDLQDQDRYNQNEIPQSYFTPRKLLRKPEVNIIMKVANFNLKIKPRTDDLNDHFYFILKMSGNQKKNTPFFKYEQMQQVEFCFNFKLRSNKSPLSRRSSQNQNTTQYQNSSQNQNSSTINKNTLSQQDTLTQNNSLNHADILNQNISIDLNSNPNQIDSVQEESNKNDLPHNNRIKCSLVQNKGNEVHIIGHFYINIDGSKKGINEIDTSIFQKGGDSIQIGQIKLVLLIDYARNHIRRKTLKQYEISETQKFPLPNEQTLQLTSIQSPIQKQNIPNYAQTSANNSLKSSIQGGLSGQVSLRNSNNSNIKDIIQQQQQFFTATRQKNTNNQQHQINSISKDNYQTQHNELTQLGYQPEQLGNAQKKREYKSYSVEKRSQSQTDHEIRSTSYQKRNLHLKQKLQNLTQINDFSMNANIDDLNNLGTINEYQNNKSIKKLQQTQNSHKTIKNVQLDNQINLINNDILIIKESLQQTATSSNQKESLIKMHAFKNRLKQIKVELGSIQQQQRTHSPKSMKINSSPSTKKLKNSHKKYAQSINFNRNEKDTI